MEILDVLAPAIKRKYNASPAVGLAAYYMNTAPHETKLPYTLGFFMPVTPDRAMGTDADTEETIWRFVVHDSRDSSKRTREIMRAINNTFDKCDLNIGGWVTISCLLESANLDPDPDQGWIGEQSFGIVLQEA